MTDSQGEHRPQRDGVPAPPRLLLWGLITLFVLAVIGTIAAVVIFQNVLTTGQQYRVVTMVPFLDALIPKHPTPEGGVIPTAQPQDNGGLSPLDLLNMPLGETETTEESSPPASETPIPTEVPVEATVTVTATPTEAPTATPTLSPTPMPTAIPTEAALVPTEMSNTVNYDNPSSARMYGFRYEQQTWNNCGPANVTMALSFYGWQEDQTYAAQYLKPGGKEDKNVSPGEMVRFVNEQTGVRALTRQGGSMELMKAFVSRNIPFIIESGSMPEGYDWIGHYRTVVGYDDIQQVVYVYDSFLGIGASGEGFVDSYDVFDDNWQDFNRTFIVVYDPAREGEVRELLGDLADPVKAAEHAFQAAQTEARANPQDAFAWFNMGTSLTLLERYDEAALAYDRARQIGLPFRMLWYQFGPFETYLNIGRYEDVLSLVEVNLTNGATDVEETYYWQGQVFVKQGLDNRAAESFRLALRHNPRYEDAKAALELVS